MSLMLAVFISTSAEGARFFNELMLEGKRFFSLENKQEGSAARGILYCAPKGFRTT